MTTAREVLNVAASQIGYHEGPNNDTPYGIEYGLNHNPWCAMYVTWCIKHAGAGLDPSVDQIHYAYVPTGVANFKNGKWGTFFTNPRDALPGDISFYWFTNRPDHTGFVESNLGGRIIAIEGNTGDMVKRVSRTSGIYGFGRPFYKNAPIVQPLPLPPVSGYVYEPPTMSEPGRGVSPADARVARVQARLNALGFPCGAVDGQFGPQTKAAVVHFQQSRHIGVDGAVGPETGAALARG